ncbi:MAG: O-methyltransferase [Acidimicrobiales bacterium]|jgi:predicted O-methyltransferase YrrM
MTQEHWTDVDRYLVDRLVPHDTALEATLQTSKVARLPFVHVAPNQGKLLHLLALATRARTILEIGTLGGYSTIWLARALAPGGRLVTLEADPRHAAVAEANIARAGLSDVVEIVVGPAAETLPGLVAEGDHSFDFVFIDADKASTTEHFAWSLQLSHIGTLIVVDNVVRGGKIADPTTDDPNVRGMQSFVDSLANEPRVSATAVQTVGSKGHDGFVLALVTSDDH